MYMHVHSCIHGINNLSKGAPAIAVPPDALPGVAGTLTVPLGNGPSVAHTGSTSSLGSYDSAVEDAQCPYLRAHDAVNMVATGAPDAVDPSGANGHAAENNTGLHPASVPAAVNNSGAHPSSVPAALKNSRAHPSSVPAAGNNSSAHPSSVPVAPINLGSGTHPPSVPTAPNNLGSGTHPPSVNAAPNNSFPAPAPVRDATTPTKGHTRSRETSTPGTSSSPPSSMTPRKPTKKASTKSPTYWRRFDCKYMLQVYKNLCR